jgi:hypothetical protein
MDHALPALGTARWRGLALLVALATVLLAACNQVGTSTLTFWDVMWSMVVFFFWFMFIWIFISIFADIFRRDDLSGGWKVIWILVLVVLPFLGALVYTLFRPKMTPQDVQQLTKADAAMRAVSSVSVADELAKLAQLRDAGAITVPEYEALKKKLLA